MADDSLLIEDSIFARCFPYAVARRTFRKLSLAYEVRKACLKAQDAVEHAFEDEMKQIAYDLKHGLASTRKDVSRAQIEPAPGPRPPLRAIAGARGADEGLKEEIELRRKCKKDCEEALTVAARREPRVTRAVEDVARCQSCCGGSSEMDRSSTTRADHARRGGAKAQLNQHIKQLYFQESWTLQEPDDREALLEVPAFRFLQQDLLAGGELEILPGADAPAGEPSGGQTAPPTSSGSIGTSRSPGKSPTTPSGGWFMPPADGGEPRRRRAIARPKPTPTPCTRARRCRRLALAARGELRFRS